MSRGRHLSLEEARNTNKLVQFAKEHPSEGDEDVFDDALRRIVQGKPTKEKGTK